LGKLTEARGWIGGVQRRRNRAGSCDMPVLSGEKWVTPGRQFPTVTWSFATNNYDFSKLYLGYNDFDGQIRDDYRPLVRSAFDAWEAVSLIDFVEVVDSAEADIRLGDIEIDGFPKPGQTTTLGIAQTWMTGAVYSAAQIWFDVDAYQDKPTFFQVAEHEIGHAIGLEHSSDPADTMYFLSNPQNASGKLSAGDISGVQQMYGVRATAPTVNMDFATAASSLFFLGALPTAAQLTSRGDFAETQYTYYATVLKVANPGIGPYEALGRAFSSETAFTTKYGVAISTATFIQTAYQDAFHRAPTTAQETHFNGQLTYFRSLYISAAIAPDKAEIQARGAVAGQMLGFAMTTASERALPAQTLDDTVNTYLSKQAFSAVGLAGVFDDTGTAAYLGFA
jgi:hypothetical protein